MAQFRAFSVYEDKPSEVEVKKRESTFKPFASKELKKENFFVSATDNVRGLCAKVEKQQEVQKEAPPVRWVTITVFCIKAFFYQCLKPLKFSLLIISTKL